MRTFRLHISRLLPSLGIRSLGRWVFYGVAIGVISGLGAALFFVLLDLTEYFAFEFLAGVPLTHPAGEIMFESLPVSEHHPLVFFLLPLIGGLLSGILVHFAAPEAAGVGTEALIEAFHKHRGQIRARVPIVKGIATLFTLGFGGASGREGPIAQIGGGFGSWFARRARLSARERRILLLAGAAGGFGAIFRAPLGGAVTAVEVLYREDFETDALVPCVISSVTSYAVFSSIFGFDSIFAIPENLRFTHAYELLFYAVLGFLCVPAGALCVKVFHGIGRAFQALKFIPGWALPAIGGLLVGVVGLVAPGAYGSGWGLVQQALDGHLLVGGMIVLMLAKIVAMSLTLGSGGSGGVFGPTMFVGAMLGGVVGYSMKALFPELAPDPAALVIVGMCGFFAGVANAPLGALLMTIELSRSYGLVAPLMLVAVIAVLFTSRWSIFKNQVKNKFDSPAHQGDLRQNVLREITVAESMRGIDQVRAIPVYATFPQIREIIKASDVLSFPVVDEREGRLVGVLSVRDIRSHMFDSSLDNLLLAQDLMGPPDHLPETANLYDALRAILELEHEELPITRGEEEELVGVIRRSDILRAYYERINHGGEDEEDTGEFERV